MEKKYLNKQTITYEENPTTLETSDANVLAILEAIEGSVVLLDKKFNIKFYNRSFEYLLSRLNARKPILNNSIFNILPHNLDDEFRISLSRALTGERGDFLHEHSDENQKTIIMQYKIEPMEIQGKVVGIALLGTDCTEKVIQDRILKIQNEELKHVSRELDRFVYCASHDLRAPLMSIRGIINLVQKDDDPGSRQQYFNHIDKSITRLDKFISEIVNYSRNARTHVQLELIDFREVIQESIDYLKYMEDASEVESIKVLKNSEPFHSDRSRIVMIFNSIIANAVQYRDKRKKSFIKISISTTHEGACILFKDNGIGIAPEHVSKIFDMFYRAHHSSSGSGLGLYNVKNAVEKLKGSITVVSEVNQGTTFRIFLPNSPT